MVEGSYDFADRTTVDHNGSAVASSRTQSIGQRYCGVRASDRQVHDDLFGPFSPGSDCDRPYYAPYEDERQEHSLLQSKRSQTKILLLSCSICTFIQDHLHLSLSHIRGSHLLLSRNATSQPRKTTEKKKRAAKAGLGSLRAN